MPLCSFLQFGIFAIFGNLATTYFNFKQFFFLQKLLRRFTFKFFANAISPGHATSGEHKMQPVLRSRHFFVSGYLKSVQVVAQ